MRRWRRLLALQAAVSGLVAFAVTAIWAMTGGSVWPIWVWYGLAIPFGLNAAALRRGAREARPLAQVRLPRRRVGLGLRDARADLGDGGQRRVLAHDPGRVPGDAPRAARGTGRHVGRRSGAGRARRRAHPHPSRRARRPGARAAPDRARPARRRAGATGWPHHGRWS